MKHLQAFVCRANYGLQTGCFELDVHDGEISFKYAVDSTNAVLSREVIRRSVLCSAAMMERYAPGIVGILFSGMTAAQAIERCSE